MVEGWRLLTARGSAAVAIVAIEGEVGRLRLLDRNGCPVDWPGTDDARLVRLMDAGHVFDEAIAVRTPLGGELHELH